MRDAERVPEHDVGVVDAGVAVLFDPFWQAGGGDAGGLGDVSACGVQLVVFVCGVVSMSSEVGSQDMGVRYIL